jgi:hypothetical protein
MRARMDHLPKYQSLAGHRVPVEVAEDPPFRMLVEAFEGRSKRTVRNDQRSSSWKPRQQFLDLLRGRVPKADALSLAFTVHAAVLHYDRISDIQEGDFAFLEDLLKFLKEYGVIGDRTFEPIEEELMS